MNAQGTSSVVAADEAVRSPIGTAPVMSGPYRAAAPLPARPRLRSMSYRTVQGAIDGTAMVTAVSTFGGSLACASAMATTLICLHAGADVYRPRRVWSTRQRLAPLATGPLILLVCVNLPFLGDAAAEPARWLGMALIYCVLAGLARCALHTSVRVHRRRRSRPRRALVVGHGAAMTAVVDRLLEHRDIGLNVLGQVPAGQGDEPGVGRLPVLGEHVDLARVLDACNIEVAVLVSDGLDREALDTAARQCVEARRETIVVLSSQDLALLGPGTARMAGMPCRHLFPGLERSSARLVKRAFDVAVAATFLIVMAPLMGLCAAALRLQDGPGVLFRQTRIGHHGREFTLLKFRTLKPTNSQESDTRWTVEGDVRIGSVGQLLRRTSLDELPQLWNVLRGDMSLVGPRPERPYFVQLFCTSYPAYAQRHRVPVGMTGWAQVNGLRGNTSIEMRAQFDNDYIDTWSFGRDLLIIMLTVRAMLLRDGR
ncbi:sugar transferase [Spirillospora sp. NPDC047279]|uniref:sugar transferase n=1 Tax=Spirillospora sp. NPDC047279 TaxID=3155478 RepID=UPI0034021191